MLDLPGINDAALPTDGTNALLDLLREIRTAKHGLRYHPYPKQREFHCAGGRHRERALIAGNQLGKSLCAANEVRYHLTGDYPDWWDGRVWNRPTVWWVASTSSGATRDNAQRILLGRVPAIGSGVLPADCIIGYHMKRGAPMAIDSATIRHKSGGISHILFKAYEQGRTNWQGDTIDGLWNDEEAPEDIYDEGLTRTNAHRGLVLNTFTPLLGQTAVVKRFYPVPNTDERHLTVMTIDDVDHYTAEEKRKIIASYPEHVREARAYGKPMMGEGAVFPIARKYIEVPPFAIPSHFKRIAGIDFGWDHPFGYVHLAMDPDAGIKYVTDAYKVRNHLPNQHVDAIKMRLGPRAQRTPIAWPHDGHQTQKGTGKAMILEYSGRDLNTLETHATYQEPFGGEQGGFHPEPGVQAMHQELVQGSMKIFAHLDPLFLEMESYHRQKGKIVDVDEDLISAWRAAYMMRRKAEPLIERPAGWIEGMSGSTVTGASWQAG
jgi:phage terminase large subunit-like protein